MKSEQTSPRPSDGFSIATLMERYLQKQAENHRDGFALPEAQGDVVGYDAGPLQVVEPRVAWEDALTALTLSVEDVNLSSVSTTPEWGNLVSAQEPGLSVAFCVGNFPQIVRNFLPVLQRDELTPVPLKLSRDLATETYSEWAKSSAQQDWPLPLLGVGALRLAQQYEQAELLLEGMKENVPAKWQKCWLNERAALAWHSGSPEEALKQWQSQEPTPLVLFNRGMASLFLNRPAQAHVELTEAVAGIPETSAWHHLGQLYLTLSAMRA